MDQFWSGTEPWVGLHFADHEAHTLGYEWHRPGQGLYDPGFFDAALRECEAWKVRNIRHHTDASDSHAPAGL